MKGLGSAWRLNLYLAALEPQRAQPAFSVGGLRTPLGSKPTPWLRCCQVEIAAGPAARGAGQGDRQGALPTPGLQCLQIGLRGGNSRLRVALLAVHVLLVGDLLLGHSGRAKTAIEPIRFADGFRDARASASSSNGRCRDSRGMATVDRLGRAYFFFLPLRKGQKTLICASILAPICGSLSNFGPVMLRKSPSVLIGTEAYCSRLTRASQPAILALQRIRTSTDVSSGSSPMSGCAP